MTLMGNELTERQEEIYELRVHKRMSFVEIGRQLGITRSAAHQVFTAATHKLASYQQEQDNQPEAREAQRLEEISFLNKIIRQYMTYADAVMQRSPRNAAEILNGMHKYYDTLIKIKGIQAPTRIETTVISDSALQAELQKIEAELAQLDAENEDESDP